MPPVIDFVILKALFRAKSIKNTTYYDHQVLANAIAHAYIKDKLVPIEAQAFVLSVFDGLFLAGRVITPKCAFEKLVYLQEHFKAIFAIPHVVNPTPAPTYLYKGYAAKNSLALTLIALQTGVLTIEAPIDLLVSSGVFCCHDPVLLASMLSLLDDAAHRPIECLLQESALCYELELNFSEHFAAPLVTFLGPMPVSGQSILLVNELDASSVRAAASNDSLTTFVI